MLVLGRRGRQRSWAWGCSRASRATHRAGSRENAFAEARVRTTHRVLRLCDSKVILVPSFFLGKVFCTQDSKAPVIVVVALFYSALFCKDKCFSGENGLELLRNLNGLLQPVHRKAAQALTCLIWAQWAATSHSTPTHVKSLLCSYKA